MCQLISWVESEGKNYYLTNKHLKGEIGRKLLSSDYKDDIEGHGAIAHYYDQSYDFGVHRECDDFSSPDNFPVEVARDFINGNMSMIGIVEDVLNKEGKEKFDKVEKPAWAEYYNIQNSAWAEYEKIQESALAEYEKIDKSAWAEYAKIQNLTMAEYRKIQESAWAEYKKIQKPAKEEYKKIKDPAMAEYEKICRDIWVELVKDKNNLIESWKDV